MGNFQENSDVCRKEYFPPCHILQSRSVPSSTESAPASEASYSKRFQDIFSVGRLHVLSETQLEYTESKPATVIISFFIYPTSLWLLSLPACSSFCRFIDNFHWGLLALAQYHPSFSRPTVTPNATHQAHLPITLAMTTCISRHWLFHYIYCRYSYFSSVFWFSFYVINWSSVTLNC